MNNPVVNLNELFAFLGAQDLLTAVKSGTGDAAFLETLALQMDQIPQQSGLIEDSLGDMQSVLASLKEMGEELPLAATLDRQTPIDEPVFVPVNLSLATPVEQPPELPNTASAILGLANPAPTKLGLKSNSLLVDPEAKAQKLPDEVVNKPLGILPEALEELEPVEGSLDRRIKPIVEGRIDINKEGVAFSTAMAKGDSLPAVAEKRSVDTLENPVGQKGWNQEIGERIAWMVNKSRPSAELRLNPPHLGTIEVKVEMNQDQAKVQFSAQHAPVREALEAAIPKLREMLAAQQIQLDDVHVSERSFDNHRNHPGNGESASGHSASSNEGSFFPQGELDPDSHEEVSMTSNGMLSLYV